MTLGVVDYGVGNINNVLRCLAHITQNARIIRLLHAEEVTQCDKLILPGVGAFGAAIENLKEKNLESAILDFVKSGKYLLGICLGMQLLFDKSYEFGEYEGLHLIAGSVVKFGKESQHFLESGTKLQDSQEKKGDFCSLESPFSTNKAHALKIPHIGWNKNFQTQQHAFTKDTPQEFYLYFVHSYHALCENKNILATCEYGVSFPSIVCQDNILGIQPHPERSHTAGFKIIQNFIDL